jgi:hypothetical protein
MKNQSKNPWNGNEKYYSKKINEIKCWISQINKIEKNLLLLSLKRKKAHKLKEY